MKALTPSGGMAQRMDQRKKRSSRYLSPRSPISIRRGGRKFRLNREKPHFQRRSETVPTGQTQEQKERLRRSDAAITARKITSPAGWTGLMATLKNHSFRLTSAEIGRNPSIPSGRETYGVAPPERRYRMKR